MTRWLLAAIVATASTAGAAPVECRDAIGAAAARFTQATVKALGACARRHVADCEADAPTAARVARVRSSLDRAVAQACCGGDRVCGTSDDESLAAIGWTLGVCPNLDRGECNGLVSGPRDVAACLACIARTAADGTAAATTVPAPSGSRTVARCAAAAAQEGTRLFTQTSRALAACWAARRAGGHANDCPVPGDGRAGPAIAAATARATSAICRACGGPDDACGGTDDLDPAAAGFPAACPAVAVPDGAACGGPITTPLDLATCLECLVEHGATCADHAAVPAFVPYPGACAPPPGMCEAGVECASAADCPAGYACRDNGSGATRYCVGPACLADAECVGGAVCRQDCTFAGCAGRRCVCPGFACGAEEVCIDDGGLACRQLCTQDSDCPPPLGVCVNSTFGAGLCISSTPCQ